MFDKILDSKKCFLDNKNINFKKSKNCIVLKGLVYGFGQNFENLYCLFTLFKIDKENVFDNIHHRKKKLYTQ